MNRKAFVVLNANRLSKLKNYPKVTGRHVEWQYL